MKATLADALDPSSGIATALNLSPTDPRMLAFINPAQRRLLAKGHWWGTLPKFTVKVTSQIFSPPPQFATVEQIAVSRQPVSLRTQFYEFNSNTWGVVNDPTATEPAIGISEAIFRGNFPTFLDVPSGGSYKLRVQCDVLADVGTLVLFLGYDDNGNWIRTETFLGSGIWQDGEYVALTQTPGTLSTKNFARVTGVQKPRTSGQVWLYADNGMTANKTLIGQYQYWEKNPDYPRYLLPMLPTTATQIDIIGKLDFIPAVNLTDWLIIGNLEAIRLACQAIKCELVGTPECLTKARLYMNGQRDVNGRIVQDGALTVLDEELSHYRGSGNVIIPRLELSGHPPVQVLI